MDILSTVHKRRIVERFEQMSCICKRKSTRRPTVLTEDALSSIQEQLDNSPPKSLRKIAAQTGMSLGSCQKALKRVHNFHPDEMSFNNLKKPLAEENIKVETDIEEVVTGTTQTGGEAYTIKEERTTCEAEFQEIKIEPFQDSDEQINDYDKTEIEEMINYTNNSKKQFKTEIDIEETVIQMPRTNYYDKGENTEGTTANYAHYANYVHERNCIKEEKRNSDFTCGECGKIFGCKSALVTHKRIHTGERPYVCKYCKKAFSQQSTLSTHERSHTGERPFQCNFCEKEYSSSSYLIRHKRVHTGERPYQCKFCVKAFTSSSHLIRHERIHTGERSYQCQYCEKRFPTSDYLIVHERIHTGERPYQCKFCEKAFHKSSDLVSHERIHTR